MCGLGGLVERTAEDLLAGGVGFGHDRTAARGRGRAGRLLLGDGTGCGRIALLDLRTNVRSLNGLRGLLTIATLAVAAAVGLGARLTACGLLLGGATGIGGLGRGHVSHVD